MNNLKSAGIRLGRPGRAQLICARLLSGAFCLRAQKVYHSFKEAVLGVSQNDLSLYIDIHQNGRQSAIEVATVGISRKEASLIKRRYREIRDRLLAYAPDVDSVDLLIEPLDNIEIGAWAAKAHGILSVVKKSLHVELPLYGTLRSSKVVSVKPKYSPLCWTIPFRSFSTQTTPAPATTETHDPN
jgi:hypothetical protein